MNVDGRKSMEEWITEAGVGNLLVLRSKDEVAQATDQMAKLAAGRHAPDPGEGTPGPAA